MALLTNKQAAVLAVAGAIGFYQAQKQMRQAAQAVNPVNPGNVFYGGVNAVGAAVTDDPGFSLGSALYDAVDWVRGLWGDSDADRRARIEAATQALIKAREYNNLPINF